jgi:signal transduction histidine kinase
MGEGGEVRVISHARDHTIVIDVEDNGCGIPAEVLKRIYEPFVTTKDPGKGTGLGMSLVYSIVEEHYGQIVIQSPLDSENGGTRVTITLPRYTLLAEEHSEVDHEEQHEPHPDR